MNNKFIVIEGLDGAGKTSIAKRVRDILYQKNIHEVVFFREPGGTPLAEAIRALIKKCTYEENFTQYAELLLFYAARIQLVEKVIKPALSRDAWVIGDRYDLSTQAYQGGGHGINANILQNIYNTFIGNLQPNIIFYLDIPPHIGLNRVKKRDYNHLDHIKIKTPIEFFKRTRARYKELAALNKNIITINANKPITEVIKEISGLLIKCFSEQNINL